MTTNLEDFEASDVIARLREDPGAFGAIPIWNDYGNEDAPLAAEDLDTEPRGAW